jgi:tripartite-type tricarboxylate transporter receptor subunit TctC
MLRFRRRHSGRREAPIRNPETRAVLASGFRVPAFGRPRNDKLRGAYLIAALIMLGMLCTPAQAQSNYPTKPITLVVPLPPGGTNDIMARTVADKMGATLGQTVVVENRPLGGSGTVATREVLRGPADGYTILLAYTSTMATGPNLFANVGYDPRKNVAPIGLIGMAPALLLVNPKVAYRNVTDLIADMKASKEPFQVGTPGINTVNYLAAVLFGHQAGVKLQYIPYKGSQALNTDLVGGFVKVGFNPIPVSRGALEGKLIRALAATSIKRSSMFPDLPTVAESGLPGFDAVLNYGIAAPAGTPRPIIEKLNKALRAALATDEVKRRMHQEGAEPMPTTPEEHAAAIDREEKKWAALIKSVGIKPK